MKQLLFVICLLLATTTAKAQAPTSQEEYNYVTKGIAIQRSSGLDMKSGYLLTNKRDAKTGAFTVSLEDLVRINDKSFAATVIVITGNPGSTPFYLCLPNAVSSHEIQEQYFATIASIQSMGIMRAIANALAIRTISLSSSLKR